MYVHIFGQTNDVLRKDKKRSEVQRIRNISSCFSFVLSQPVWLKPFLKFISGRTEVVSDETTFFSESQDEATHVKDN